MNNKDPMLKSFAGKNLTQFRETAWKLFGVAITLGVFFGILSWFYLPKDLLFPNSDFESGNLLNWTIEERAFKNQPTFGDNSYYRDHGSAHPVGNYYIGTRENRPTPYLPKGGIQGDEPIGRLVSIPFLIRRDHLSFLIGGGDDSPREVVMLEVGEQIVLVAQGKAIYFNGERMSRVTWDVSRWKGTKAKIIIEDNSSGKWGHINADDFRFR